MVDLSGAFDETATPSSDFDLLPPGWYTARIIELTIEDVSRTEDKGKRIVARWQIADGEHQGRLFFQDFNTMYKGGKNEAATRGRANSDFAKLREGVGVTSNLADDYLHIDCEVHLDIETPNGYSPRNKVLAIQRSGASPGGSSAPAAKPAAARPANPFQKAKEAAAQ